MWLSVLGWLNDACIQTKTLRQGCARVIPFQKLQFKICLVTAYKHYWLSWPFSPAFPLSIFHGPYENTALQKLLPSGTSDSWRRTTQNTIFGQPVWSRIVHNIAIMDKQREIPSVCYLDLRFLRTKKISLLFFRLDSKREEKTLSSPCCLAEPYIAQTSPETALGKCQAYWMQVITMFLRHCHPSLSWPCLSGALSDI